MSPILKRDVFEHARQARRFAAAATGIPLTANEDEDNHKDYRIGNGNTDSRLTSKSSNNRLNDIGGVDVPQLERLKDGPDISNRTIYTNDNGSRIEVGGNSGLGLGFGSPETIGLSDRFSSGVRHLGIDEEAGKGVLDNWKQTTKVDHQKEKRRANGIVDQVQNHDEQQHVSNGHGFRGDPCIASTAENERRTKGFNQSEDQRQRHNEHQHQPYPPHINTHHRMISSTGVLGSTNRRASTHSSSNVVIPGVTSGKIGDRPTIRTETDVDEDDGSDDEGQRWGLRNGDMELDRLVPGPTESRGRERGGVSGSRCRSGGRSRSVRENGNGSGVHRRGTSGQMGSPVLSEDSASDLTTMSAIEGKWTNLRNLLLECTTSLLISLVGLVFTGELLEHLARWTVFRRVDELFILVPILGNLKGNLEMCLSARLGTSANIGELDDRRTRRLLLTSNMTLLCLQALLISSLAAITSFVLGLITTHRLGDAPPPAAQTTNSTYVGPLDPGLAVGEQEWHEGYTRPGWKQLVMVLATGMAAAGGSSIVIGSFMSSAIVMCRWFHIDPDNITPPVAACLGDLVTLFILSLIGTVLVGTMDSPIPLIAVIIMSIAAVWFTRRVMRDEWVKNVARGGWIPLIGAMLISSGTGMVLEKGVGKYRGFALLAISMTGLTGSLGAIHANRLSTSLHTGLHPTPSSSATRHHGITPGQEVLTLFILAFPCQAAFLLSVNWAGWIDISLGWAGWVAFAATSGFSIILAHYMTLLFWAKDLDPDSYTLPIHSAIVDCVGQLVLMLAYEICVWSGNTSVTDVI